MNLTKKITVSIIFLWLLFLAACGTGDKADISIVEESNIQGTESANPAKRGKGTESVERQSGEVSSRIVDYEALGIKKYEYPEEFSLGDNLKTAIAQLALSYENFDKDSVGREGWKESFVAKFIQNSRLSFDYLDRISDQNNGRISTDELNYIHYSLTGIELDFSSYADGNVNRYDSASFLNYGFISRYDYEYTDRGVIITAGLEVGYDGTDWVQEREITVELIKNLYSCFDGYSVVNVSSKTAASSLEPDRSTHIFYGSDMMAENNGVFPFEFLSSEDDLRYKHFVYVDLTELPDLADLVRQNGGKDFRVTFIRNEGNADAVEKIVPVDILLEE